MKAAFAHRFISLAEFKKNPMKAVCEAGIYPVAILSRDRLVAYLVEPMLFEAMVDRLEDIELAELAAQRLASGEKSIPASLDSL